MRKRSRRRIIQYPLSRAAAREARGAGMRRGIVDKKDRMWWGGFDGGFVGMLVTSQPAGKETKLFPLPLPGLQPYISSRLSGK